MYCGYNDEISNTLVTRHRTISYSLIYLFGFQGGEKDLKRTLTTVAAASMALGMLVPVAFASSSTAGLKKAGQLPIVVNGAVLSNPFEMTGVDSGNTTGFFPIYYFSQALSQLGFSAAWDGATHTWAITAPGVTVGTVAGGVGTGNTTVTVNGTAVKKFNSQAAKDPAGGPVTTYLPVYYIQNVLGALGVNGNWSGTKGLSVASAAQSQGAAKLSALTTSGANSGDGSATNPAVSLNNAAVSVSTTLTDANGNALANTAVTFSVSNYGNYPSTLPTVKNAAGTVVSGTAKSNAEQYTVYTDASGVAKVSFTNPSGQTNAYQVVAQGPYLGASNLAVSTSPAFVEFVSNNTAGLAPYAQSGTPFNASIGTPVPVTVTLPPNAQGQAQANVLVTLTVTKADGTQSNASFVNASGAVLGAQVQVSTNASGVAQAFLSDANGESLKVSVSGLPTGVNAPSATYIKFAQAGVPAKIGDISVSTNSPSIGDQVVVSGQLQDASGNAVPGGQILVTSPNGASNHFAYVNGTMTTTFPLIGTVDASGNQTAAGLAVGTPATSAYGDVVTADNAGYFNFSVTDPRVETQEFFIYPVVNGEVESTTPLNGTATSNNNKVSFSQSTNLAYLSVGAFDAYVQGNSDTSTTGLSARINGGGNIAGTLTSDEVANVFVEPQNSAGHHASGDLTTTPLTYSLSLDNGGLIYSINGHNLTSPAAAVTLSYDGAGGFTANGQSIGALNVAPSTFVSDFSVGVSNSNAGNTNLTITSGSITSKATVDFTGGTPAQVATFTPGSVIVNGGQQQKVTFQVQDANGNPVPNTATNVVTDQSAADGFYVTQVNGVTLSESLNMGNSTNASYTTESTPIPLGSVPASLNYSVGMPGVAQWTHGANFFTVYSDASGNVTLTLQAGGLNYPTTVDATYTSANPNNYAPTVSGNGWLGFYSNGNTGDTAVPLYVYESPSTPAGSFSGSVQPTGQSAAPFSGSLLGQINW
jgi:hypothetical protein